MYIVHIFLTKVLANKRCKALTTRWHIFLFVTSNWLRKIKYLPSYCHHIVLDLICGIVFTNKLITSLLVAKLVCPCQCRYLLQSNFLELEGGQCVLLITAKTHSI